MTDRTRGADIDDRTGSEMFLRNIMNSQRIVGGAFEDALADILDQYAAYAGTTEGGKVSASVLTRRIGREIRRGLAGLHPNGFEFAIWLWDVAPIHHIEIQADSALRMRELVFYYLRTLAAIITQDYVAQQPDRAGQVVELLDSSILYLDARNLLVLSGLLSQYQDQVIQQYHELLALAEGRQVRRKLLPLVVCEAAVERHPEHTSRCLALAERIFPSTGDRILGYAMFKALTAALWHGESGAFAEFLVSRELEPDPFIRRMFADIIAGGDARLFTPEFVTKAVPVLTTWEREAGRQQRPGFLRALKALERRGPDGARP